MIPLDRILLRGILLIFLTETNLYIQSQDTLHFTDQKDFVNSITHVFKDNHPELSFFKYRAFGGYRNIFDYYKGQPADSVCDVMKYLYLVNQLDIANYNTDSLINLAHLETLLLHTLSKSTIPISIAFVKYSSFKDSALYLNAIGFANNQFTETMINRFYPFREDTLMACSALNHVLNTASVSFLISDSLILSNIRSSIDSISIDYGEGNGFRPLIRGNIAIVIYERVGEKLLKVKVFCGKKIFYSAFRITIRPESDQNEQGSHPNSSCNFPNTPPDRGPDPISTSILSANVHGEYAVWYSPCNHTRPKHIRKPYFVMSGFNPGSGKQLWCGNEPSIIDLTVIIAGQTITIPISSSRGKWRGTYYETYNGVYNEWFSPAEVKQFGDEANNGNQYLDRLRDQGYDIIILQPDDGTDNTVHNAALLMQLIQDVDAEEFDSGFYFENVVSGFSAGAVSSRLALALMEERWRNHQGPHPHTKLWISIDGEHEGSNVPIGLTHLLDYQQDPTHVLPSWLTPVLLPGYSNLINLDIANQLVATAAWQLDNNRLAHELTNFTSNYPVNPERAALLNLFGSIPGNTSNGYPEFCRRVGVSQGSGTGVVCPHSSDYLFDSQLCYGLSPQQETSFPSSCGGTYTWYFPNIVKRTTARWWGAVNRGAPVFDGRTVFDGRLTVMGKFCVELFGCQCLGPLDVDLGSFTTAQVSKPKPVSPVDYDDCPASSQSFHLDLAETSLYPLYNYGWIAGPGSFARHDLNLCNFVPTVSALELHDPTNGYKLMDNFGSPVGSLGLMYRSLNVPSLSRRYGFPHITYPKDHYKITPFDGVYAVGDNNGLHMNGTPYPPNQFHVEDPQKYIGDYLEQVEVAPEDLFLSDRTIGVPNMDPGYIAEFEARNTITVGNGIYALRGNKNNLTPDGDFEVNTECSVILHAGEEIALLPGTSINPGSELGVYIQPYACPDPLGATKHIQAKRIYQKLCSEILSSSNTLPESEEKEVISPNMDILIYPNPSHGQITLEKFGEGDLSSTVRVLDLTGQVVFKETVPPSKISSINIQDLDGGIYLIEIITGSDLQRFKHLLQK